MTKVDWDDWGWVEMTRMITDDVGRQGMPRDDWDD